MGGVGGCTHGGVDEHLRVPLRDTQEVSITLTPMLQVRTQMHIRSKLRDSKAKGWERGGAWSVLYPGGRVGGASRPVGAPEEKH